MIRRLSFILLTIIIGIVWILSIMLYILMAVMALVIVAPILWIIGGNKLVNILTPIKYHKNKDLWYYDFGPFESDGTFDSIIPIWGNYLINKLKYILIPNESC